MATFVPYFQKIFIKTMKKIAALLLITIHVTMMAHAQTDSLQVQKKDSTVSSKRDSLKLDSIYKSLELKEVEVVKQKSLVKADIDKITYDIENDPDSKSNSVIEMLRKVPMVTVDGEDNIQVNGSSSFKVYVNNKPNNLMSNNPKEVLKSMPANSIKKIEVITNPGPKYDAEGVGGILNIITQGSGLEGYTATFRGSVSNSGGGGGAFATVKAGKLTVSGNYNLDCTYAPRSYNGSSRKTLAGITESSSDVEINGSSKSHGTFQFGSVEASYEIDTLRLITGSFSLWGGGNKGDSEGTTVATSPLSGKPLYRFGSLNHNSSSMLYVDGELDYQRSFSVKERLLTFSYKIDTNPRSSDSYTNYEDAEAAEDWQDFLHRMKNQQMDGSQNSTEHTFQLDYTTPFGKVHKFETGVKYILRNNHSENDRYEQDVFGSTAYTYDRDHSSHYKHRNDIMAAYLGYGVSLKKFTGRLGLRYEHTLQDVEYKIGRGDDFTKHFNDFVPSASIGYKLKPTSNLRFGYDMRIYRPGIWYLNPYLNDANPASISQGNSRLDSEKAHSFSLSFGNFTPKFNLNLALRYSFTNNSIESVTRLIKDTEIPGLQNPTGMDVLYNTYENIGHSQRVNLNSYVTWNATKNTRIYVNSRLSYVDMDDGGALHNYGWSFFGYGGIQQTLPKDWRITVGFYGMTPNYTLQGRGNGYSSYSLSINKQLLKKRLNLSISANNFLKKYRSNHSHLEDAYFLQETWGRTVQQRFSFSISYRIGELRSSVKKAERAISNNDVKGGGDSNGGSGSSE